MTCKACLKSLLRKFLARSDSLTHEEIKMLLDADLIRRGFFPGNYRVTDKGEALLAPPPARWQPTGALPPPHHLSTETSPRARWVIG